MLKKLLPFISCLIFSANCFAATLTPAGMDSNGLFHIASNSDIIASPALVGAAGTPIITLGGGAGTGATVSITGTNLSGKIVLNTGTGVLLTGTVMTMAFANGFAFPSGCVITFSAGDSNFASILTKLYASTTASSITLSTALTALSVSTTYTGYYTVTGW